MRLWKEMKQIRGQRLYILAQCQKVITRLVPESKMKLKSNTTWASLIRTSRKHQKFQKDNLIRQKSYTWNNTIKHVQEEMDFYLEAKVPK